MNLTREEQETVIRCSAADQEWDICTADPRMIHHLEKQGYSSVPDHQLSDPYVAFRIPFRSLRARKAEKRKLSLAELERRRRNLTRIRFKRNSLVA